MIMLAYLDGGTGSLILQAILGGTAGMAVAWKTFRDRLRRRGHRPADEPQVEPAVHGGSE